MNEIKNVKRRSIKNVNIDVSEIIAKCIDVMDFAVYNIIHIPKATS